MGEEFSEYDLCMMCTDDFEIMEVLGEGAIGTVYLAQYKPNEKLYALKMVEVEHQNIIREGLDSASTINHKNLIRFYGYFFDKYEGCFYYITIMEFFQGRDLFDLAREEEIDDYLFTIVDQVIAGLKYLHKRGYIHRDIKVENIMINDDRDVKIVDYDFLTKNGNDGFKCGTPYYKAPELITGLDPDYRIDLWSLGVTIFVMTYGDYPFTGKNTKDLYRNIVTQRLSFKGFPNMTGNFIDYKKIVKGLLKKDPDKRMSLERVSKILSKYETV